jgi:hypothetical protein
MGRVLSRVMVNLDALLQNTVQESFPLLHWQGMTWRLWGRLREGWVRRMVEWIIRLEKRAVGRGSTKAVQACAIVCHDTVIRANTLLLVWYTAINIESKDMWLVLTKLVMIATCYTLVIGGIVMGGSGGCMGGIMGVLVMAVDMGIVDLHWARAKHRLIC